MKTLISILFVMMVVGCQTPEQKLRDSVIGEYEFKENGVITKWVFLGNGVREWYDNDKKRGENKWSIVDGEIHIVFFDFTRSYRVNKDKSITLNAKVIDGKQEFYDFNNPFKKIK